MALVFRSPQSAIDAAIRKLKADGVVHPEAAFNPSAPDGLRREIAYRDLDFVHRLGATAAEEETVDGALDLLAENGLLPGDASYDNGAYENHRRAVKESFSGRWTSMTPTMERLIYALTSVRRPARLLELGSFWGYTLAWFAGPCIGADRTYVAEKIYGIDIDADMVELARGNFTKLPNCEEVELIAEDARTALERIPGPFDFVYIEAKGDTRDDESEGLYLPLLKQVYDRLSDGAWVIAHDSIDWTFREEMAKYLPYVRDRSRFRESVSFEIDYCGLELSIR